MGQTLGQLRATLSTNELTLSWQSTPGKSYKLYRSGCHSEPWEGVNTDPAILTASGSELSYAFTIDSVSRLYRVAEIAVPGPLAMVWIPAGTFQMGSPLTEVDRQSHEGPQMEVTISNGFWMGQYEVTQAEYEEIAGVNPSFFNGVQDWPTPGIDYGTDTNRPVEQVSWEDAVAFCATLTDRERLAGRIPQGSHYRLPTEAEWEYACRAGSFTRFSYGDDSGYTLLANYGWYLGNSNRRTHPVGEKLPNAWGLYDMHGNVWEWCLDWYGPYPGGAVMDPKGPATGSFKVIRGGTLGWNPDRCRSANRDTPRGQTFDFGFRVVLASSPQ